MDNFLTYDNAHTLIEKIGTALPQKATLPTASADWVGKIVQYIGETDSNYTNGYFYQCDSYFKGRTIYYWKFIDVADVDNKIDNKLNSKLSEKQNKIIQSNVFTLSRNSWTKNLQGIYEQTITVNVNWTVNSTHYKNIINVPNNYINSWSLYGIKIKNYLLSAWTTSSPTGSESSGENINTITFSCKREPTSDFTFTITSIDIGSKDSELIYSIIDTSNFTIEGWNYNFIYDGPSTTLTTNIKDSANGYIQRIYINGHSEVVNGGIVAVGEVASRKIKSVSDAGWGVVDLGDLTWVYNSSASIFSSEISNIKLNAENKKITLCEAYNEVATYPELLTLNKGLWVHDSQHKIVIRDVFYNDETTFKSAMSGVLLYYPLADATGTTPILGIISKDGAGQGTAATITTGLPLRSVSDSIFDTLDNEKVIKKCAKVKLADLTWSNFITGGFAADLADSPNGIIALICSKYPYDNSITFYWSNFNTYDNKTLYRSSGKAIYIKDTDYTTVSDFVASLGDAELVYELATPIEIPLTSAEKSALASLRTYNSNTQLDVTDAHTFNIHYLRNTDNGQAVADIQTDLQEQIDDKTDKVTSAISGNFAGLDENGNLTDSGKNAADFATASDMTAVQGVIPSTATTSNKLATASDVTGEDISSTSTTSPITDSADGMVQGIMIYGRSEVVEGEIVSVGEGWATVDLGTLDWVYRSGENSRMESNFLDVKPPESGVVKANIMCAKYATRTSNEIYYHTYDKAIAYHFSVRNLWVYDTDYTDATQFKAAMSGVILCYQLADPTQGNAIAVKTDDGTGIDSTMATFTTALPLRGVSDTIRDKLICTAESKQVETVCGKVKLADLTWEWWSQHPNIIYAQIPNMLTVGLTPKICNIYPFNSNYAFQFVYEQEYPDKMIYGSGISEYIFIKDTDYSTKEDFVASLGDAELVYELAEPVTTPLTSAEISAFRGLLTYDSTTNITITDEPDFELDYLKNTENGQAVADIQRDLQEQIDEVKNATKPRVYAFYVDQNDSNPATCVHPYYNTKYGCDNLFYQNAYMDYEKDEFNYGSWEDFIKEFFKPCMLAYDGHVDYYLDPDDYETKLDGGTSDIKDMSYNGNVMVQIKTLYFKRWTTGGKYYCIISDKKLDKSFKAFAHHDIKGNVLDYIYRAAYDGSYDGTRLRSISGIDYHNLNALTVNKIMSNTTRQQEINFAKANNDTDEKGEGWNILHKAEWDLINDLLLLIGMSTNTQATFGNGNISSYVSTSNTGIIATGTMDKKGLFYGKNDNVSGVKVFGIEMPWGNIWKSCLGWILSANQHLVKMTPGNEDGSTATDYNLDGTGYVATGKSITANGYISAFDGADTGFLPTAASGSATTYMCDYVWQNTAIYFALVGGRSTDGARCGAFCAGLNASAANLGWDIGAALSYKPLARG